MPARGSADEHPDSGCSVYVQYVRPADELTAIFDDTPNIEISEPLDDLELIYDASEPGRLVGLILRGARLGRHPAWLHAVETVLGTSLWATYQHLAHDTSPVLDDEGDEVDELRCQVPVPGNEWARLRTRTWLALHQSLHQGDWWYETTPSTWHIEPPDDDAGGPWVIAAPIPPRNSATNLCLPAPLARICGLDPIGYVRQTPEGFAVTFDTTDQEWRPERVTLQLAGPCPATGTARQDSDEIEITFEARAALDGRGLFVVAEEPHPVGTGHERIFRIAGSREHWPWR